MYKLALALGAASSALVAAQSTTTLLLLGFDSQTIDANIVGSDATATTFSLYCPEGTDSTDCGIPPNFLFTQGPSTAGYVYTVNADGQGLQTMYLGCQVTKDHGNCVESMAGQGATGVLASASSFQYSNYATDIGAQAVTIVDAGASPGATGPTTVASTAAKTTSGSPAAQTTGSSTGSSSTSPTGSSSVSTGGMPMITGSAQWVIGGAAAAAALAVL